MGKTKPEGSMIIPGTEFRFNKGYKAQFRRPDGSIVTTIASKEEIESVFAGKMLGAAKKSKRVKKLVKKYSKAKGKEPESEEDEIVWGDPNEDSEPAIAPAPRSLANMRYATVGVKKGYVEAYLRRSLLAAGFARPNIQSDVVEHLIDLLESGRAVQNFLNPYVKRAIAEMKRKKHRTLMLHHFGVQGRKMARGNAANLFEVDDEGGIIRGADGKARAKYPRVKGGFGNNMAETRKWINAKGMQVEAEALRYIKGRGLSKEQVKSGMAHARVEKKKRLTVAYLQLV